MKKLPEDRMVLELLPEFIDSWISDINEQFTLLYEARDQKNNDFYRFAHTLKGSGFQFGLDEVGEMGLEMMYKIKEGKWEELAEYKQKLLDEFTQAKEFVEKNL